MDSAKLSDREWGEAISRIREAALPLIGREVKVTWHYHQIHRTGPTWRKIRDLCRRLPPPMYRRLVKLFWKEEDVTDTKVGVLTGLEPHDRLAKFLGEAPSLWISVMVDGHFITFIEPATTIEATT